MSYKLCDETVTMIQDIYRKNKTKAVLKTSADLDKLVKFLNLVILIGESNKDPKEEPLLQTVRNALQEIEQHRGDIDLPALEAEINQE